MKTIFILGLILVVMSLILTGCPATPTGPAVGAAGDNVYQGTSWTPNRVPYIDSNEELSGLAAGTAGQILTSNGTASPYWSTAATGDMETAVYDPTASGTVLTAENATYATTAGSAASATTATNLSGGTVNATSIIDSGNLTVTGSITAQNINLSYTSTPWVQYASNPVITGGCDDPCISWVSAASTYRIWYRDSADGNKFKTRTSANGLSSWSAASNVTLNGTDLTGLFANVTLINGTWYFLYSNFWQSIYACTLSAADYTTLTLINSGNPILTKNASIPWEGAGLGNTTLAVSGTGANTCWNLIYEASAIDNVSPMNEYKLGYAFHFGATLETLQRYVCNPVLSYGENYEGAINAPEMIACEDGAHWMLFYCAAPFNYTVGSSVSYIYYARCSYNGHFTVWEQGKCPTPIAYGVQCSDPTIVSFNGQAGARTRVYYYINVGVQVYIYCVQYNNTLDSLIP